MPWLSKTFLQGAHSALRGAAAGSVERLYHHPVAFGKSGKHRANKLAAPVVFRDGHSVPMQNISPPKKNKTTNGNRDILVPPRPALSFVCDRYRNVSSSLIG
jgi:hypothetical protein